MSQLELQLDFTMLKGNTTKQLYGYIYFIFAGYRVAVGKTQNLYTRRTQYQRTHFEIQILGLIPCQSKEELDTKEKQILKLFETCNVFRDIFYFTPEMKDWVVENTIPFTKSIENSLLQQISQRNAQYWAENPEYREKQKKRKQRLKK